MRKALVIIAVVVAAAVAFFIYNRAGDTPAQAQGQTPPGAQRAARGGAGGGFGGPGGFGGGLARPPMTVELAPVTRTELTEHIVVVGNLIGAATVEVAPKITGRLQDVYVRLGDRVGRGQRIAMIEDREIREQVKQAEASFEVARATIRQREADLKFNETSLERSRSLFGRQLVPRQTLDDAEARQQAAQAQLDLARAQFTQAQARLDELRINLANTVIAAPVDGFVGKRYFDPGAFVSPNQPVALVVDIRFVRLVANLVEKDVRRVGPGADAAIEVDAYPGENFSGKVARVSPVLDPDTRTAEMEIEITNTGFRLKPGMYARVRLEVERRANALVVPRNALVDFQGKRGVFVPDGNRALFKPVETGLEDAKQVEVRSGLDDGARVVTTGATALSDGEAILLPGQAQGRAGGPGGPSGAQGGGRGAEGSRRPGGEGGFRGGPGRPGGQGSPDGRPRPPS